MDEHYEHEGRPLNKSIIRDILTNKQPPPKEWLSIDNLTEKTIQYHLDNGGEPPNIIKSYLPTREILLELYDAGRVSCCSEKSIQICSNPIKFNRIFLCNVML